MSFRRNIALASACLVASTLVACTDSDTVVAVNLVAEYNVGQLNLVATDGSKSTPLAGQVFHVHVQQDGQTPIELSMTFPTSETPEALNDDGSVKSPKVVALVGMQFNQRVVLPESWSEGEATIKTDPISLTWTATADDQTSSKTELFAPKDVKFDVIKNSAVAAFVDVKVPADPPAPSPSASAAPSAPVSTSAAASASAAPSTSGSVADAAAGDAGDAAAP